MLCCFAYSKNSYFFVGQNFNATLLNINYAQNISLNYQYIPIPLEIYNKKGYAFDSGISFGFLHFFDSKPNMGININLPIKLGFSTSTLTTIFNDTNSEQISHLKFDFYNIKTGIDIQYLYNFLNKKNYSLGILAGISLDFNFYISINSSINGFSSIDRPHFYNIGLSPNLGLLYIFGNNYISLTYKLGAIGPILSTYSYWPIIKAYDSNLGYYEYFVEHNFDYSNHFSLNIGFIF